MSATRERELVTTRGGRRRDGGGDGHDPDPVTTQVIRNGLNSAAEQMKRALIRTSFSPVIYEVLDFAVALYDRDMRMLAQAPSLPLFMGTLSFCVEGAVQEAGGVETLREGDILLHNVPYSHGSHPQDAATVMPAFHEGELIGYAAIKAHWLDLGAKDPYCTDTVDVFQEGLKFPGVRLYREGRRNEDIYRLLLANCRVPDAVAGDVNAQVIAVRQGVDALLRLLERYGRPAFEEAVERMYDHGERTVRGFFRALPNGTYVGRGCMDNDGVGDEQVPFEVEVRIDDDEVVIDFSRVPDARPGPINCPMPSTVSASRTAITMLAGGGEAPCEGHFRPIAVITRPGSMFHPESPSPCYLYGWPAFQSIEVIYEALADAVPQLVPAWSGGDLCGLTWWGRREATGEAWADSSPNPIGMGAHAGGDGAHALLHIAESATRFSPIEVWEERDPLVVERYQLAQDSGGAGRHQGGLGVDLAWTALEPIEITTQLERTESLPLGREGGMPGRPNRGFLRSPDGERRPVAKATRMAIPVGWTIEVGSGGGGGFGDPAQRPREQIVEDLADGVVSEEYAARHYPQWQDGADGS